MSRKDYQMMELCMRSAEIFSTCGKRQYTAILTDEANHIVGMGYNGGPPKAKHCRDGGCPRFLADSQSGTSYDNCIAVHAEQNAFLHSDYSSNPTKLYVNGMPCYTCAKLIVNSTVKELFCFEDKSYIQYEETLEFLTTNNIKVSFLKSPIGLVNASK